MDIMEESDGGSHLVTCNDCGREVPEANMTMHQLRACQARARRPGEHEAQGSHNDNEPQPMEVDPPVVGGTRNEAGLASAVDVASVDSDDDSEVQVVDGSNATFKACPSSPTRSTRPRAEDPILESPQQGMRRRRRRVVDGTTGAPPPSNVAEVVDLVEDTPESAEGPPGLGADEWACPQCTLHNPKGVASCAACNLPNPERAPDPVRRDRLIGDITSDLSPLAFVSGGALMGGLLGAAGSFIRGRDPFSAVAEGAMTGVMGGAFLNEVMSSRRGNTSRQRNSAGPGTMQGVSMEEYLTDAVANHQARQQERMSVAQARSSASITGGYPSMNGSSENSQNGNQRARPRSSFRVTRERNDDGTTTTLVMGGNSTTRIRRNQGGIPQDMDEHMLSLLLHSYLEQQREGSTGGFGAGNIDGMSYEELLQAFGDGTENLGASDAQIASLPESVVENPEKELPEDARQCWICLEDIVAGETRTILPCLHGFHSTCCSKWLRTNGSCPICKHRLR